MLLRWVIEKLGLGDYYFVVDKKNKFNTTGKLELHTLNSENFVTSGLWNGLKYIVNNR